MTRAEAHRETKRLMAERLTRRQTEAVVEFVFEAEVSRHRRRANHNAPYRARA